MPAKRSTEGERVHGRKALGERRFDDKVARRVSGVEIPDLPWDQREVSPERAERLGLITLADYAKRVGVSFASVDDWSRKFSTFPEPVCVISRPPPSPGIKTRGYDLATLASWHRLAAAQRHVHSLKPGPDDGS